MFESEKKMNPIITLLAATRLTRFVTTDKLGGWLITEPAQDWAAGREAREVERLVKIVKAYGDTGVEPGGQTGPLVEHARTTLENYDPDEPVTWQAKLVSGLECPYCVGFWITAATLGLSRISRRTGILGTGTRFLLEALAASWVTGHLGEHFDD